MSTVAIVGTPGLGRIGRRLGARVLHKDPHPPLERFGFHLHEAASRQRTAAIIEAFFTGYNAALEADDPAGLRARCTALPAVLHPFAFEGTGMGYGARGLVDWSSRPGRFETHVATVEPGWEFMYYVGLGIWTAFVGAWATRRAAAAVGNPALAGLLFDGFGFQRGFFHRARDPHAHERLAGFPAAERAQAYRGFGRSLWFVFRDDRAGLEQAVATLPADGRDHAIVGIGLAVVFTAADDLAAAIRQLATFPASWRRDLDRGARLALYVRHCGQPVALERWITAAGDSAPMLRTHLDHARRARNATPDDASFLTAFTAAC